MALELAGGLASTEAERLLQAEALVRSYCGWHIAPSRTETKTLPDAGPVTVFLPSLHVTSVTVTRDSATLAAGTDYEWDQSQSWVRVTGAVEIEYTHGYAEAPADVAAVVQSVAQRAVNNPGSLVRTQDGPFADTYSQTGFNQSLPIALLDAEKEILRPYKVMGVA